MSPTVFRFVTAIERFANEKGLEVDYRNNIEEQYIDLFFRDSICKHHQSRAPVYFTEIFRHADVEAFANHVVNLAARVIRKFIAEEMRKDNDIYFDTGSFFYKPELFKYVKNDIENMKRMTKNMINSVYGIPKNSIKDVIFNPPATIVMWKDGSKTVVKAQNDEPFDPEKGLAMAIAKKALGNQGNYFETIKKWTEAYKPTKEKVVSDVPKSEGERWGVYVDGSGWIKGRKRERVDGKKIFHVYYTYTDNESEALTWKTKDGADRNAKLVMGARAVHMK